MLMMNRQDCNHSSTLLQRKQHPIAQQGSVLLLPLLLLMGGCATQSAPTKITVADCPKQPTLPADLTQQPQPKGYWSSSLQDMLNSAQQKLTGSETKHGGDWCS